MLLKTFVQQVEEEVNLGLSLEIGTCGVYGLYRGNRLILLGRRAEIESRLTILKQALGGIETPPRTCFRCEKPALVNDDGHCPECEKEANEY